MQEDHLHVRLLRGLQQEQLQKNFKKVCKTNIYGYVSQLGNIIPSKFNKNDIENPFSFQNKQIKDLEEYINSIRKEGDSIGAKVSVVANKVPGLGNPVFDKTDALLAQAMMSINAVKGVSIGSGFEVVDMKGSECR